MSDVIQTCTDTSTKYRRVAICGREGVSTWERERITNSPGEKLEFELKLLLLVRITTTTKSEILHEILPYKHGRPYRGYEGWGEVNRE